MMIEVVRLGAVRVLGSLVDTERRAWGMGRGLGVGSLKGNK